MRWRSISILLVVIIYLSVNPAYSAKRVALVIGNSDYQSAPLKNPVNDATDMAATLADLGFEVITETDTTKRDMVSAIDRFAQKLSRAEIGLFYYAGHGMQINGRNYLIPVKAAVIAESDVEFEAVDAGRILGRMRLAGNKLNVVVLDACRNNPFARSFRSSTQGLAPMDAPMGTIVAYASSPGSIAADGTGRNGIYTKHLLSALKKPNLGMQDVFNEAGIGVMAETGNQQIPWTSNTPIPRYYLAGGEPTTEDNDSGPGISAGETGSLKVTSTPAGAEVLINGTNVGKTPLTLDRIHSGFMKVRIFKESHMPEIKEVLVIAGERVAVEVELEQEVTTGILTMKTTPTDAQVRILNIKPKYQPGMELPAGSYHVEVSADRYEKSEQWIELAAGDNLTLEVNLMRTERKVTAQSTVQQLAANKSGSNPGVRFVDNGNGTVTDTKTGLMWAAKDNGQSVNWYEAKEYCYNFTAGGYTNWRLPSLGELSGLHVAGLRPNARSAGDISNYINLSKREIWASNDIGKEAALLNFEVGGDAVYNLFKFNSIYKDGEYIGTHREDVRVPTRFRAFKDRAGFRRALPVRKIN